MPGSGFPFMAGVWLECGKGWSPLIRALCRELTAAYDAAGKPGRLRTDLRWIQTLCDEHYQERENCL